MATFNYFSIAETLEKFRRKEISPFEVITAHLQRAQALQPKLNAFVHLDAESALAWARQASFGTTPGQVARTAARDRGISWQNLNCQLQGQLLRSQFGKLLPAEGRDQLV